MINIYGKIMCAWGKHKNVSILYEQFDAYVHCCGRCHAPDDNMFAIARICHKNVKKALDFHIITHGLLDSSFNWQGAYDKETDPYLKAALLKHSLIDIKKDD